MNVIRDCLPKVCRVKPQPQAHLPSRQEVTEDTRRPKKKALLIGVQYTSMGDNALKGPHKDVAAMRKLLIEKYQYNPKDIVVLVDTKNSKQKPTRDNMVTEMKNLVLGAAPGDRFFFHYAGHAAQVPTEDRKEEDGMDECIIPCDSTGSPDDPKLIKDDLLKEILVDRLPTGCHLVAIFDACHSASLLDLKHFRCNRVYVPWISKGRRKSNSLWLANVRQDAAMFNTRTIHQTSRMSKDVVKTRRTSMDRPCGTSEKEEQALPPTPASHIVEFTQEHHSCQSPCHAPSPLRPRPVIKTEGITPVTRPRMPSRSSTRDKKRQSASSYKTSLIPWFDDRAGQELIVESPVEEYCSGSCRGRPSPIVGRKLTLGSIKSPASALRSPMGPPANVISLGSCKDSQLAWEDLQGSSMTQTLVDLLSSDPHPTLNDFMTKLSHTMHDRLLHMHCANREFKKKKKLWRLKRSKKASVEGDTKGAEISNFQDPQLSSHKPLDMDSRLDL